MNNLEKDDLIRTMLSVAQYYNRKLPTEVMDIYIANLKDFDLDDIKKALSIHALTPESGQFFPKLADIMRHMSGGTQDKALVAWTKIDWAVRHIGPYKTAAFDDPIIHQVIQDMGGWIALNEKTEAQWPFLQNEFVKRYAGYLHKGGVSSDCQSKLTGIEDMQNRLIGIEIEKNLKQHRLEID